MKSIKLMSLSGFSVAAGIIGGFLVAPQLHNHSDPTTALSAMWAHNYDTVAELTEDVDTIVRGKVLQTVPGRTFQFADGRPDLFFTYVDVSVDKAYKGEVSGSITLEHTGGDLNDRSLYFENDGGPYHIGDEVLLFLKEQSEPGVYYVAHPAARFNVENGVLASLAPDHPVGAQLDGRPVKQALDRIRPR